ncbi:MAG: hypothetical protein LBE56_12985 [Tannerella sp.]|jgi:hypothetical protein|nr:hypothetical protein [Tannerella sp.]
MIVTCLIKRFSCLPAIVVLYCVGCLFNSLSASTLEMTTGNLNDSTKAKFEADVKEAVTRQMTVYPYSTLKDLYKNFFQDRFGPGHLIADTAEAGKYLRSELASFDISTGAAYESTGWEGCYLRVNLSFIKEKIIPYDVFFEAFVRSVNQITPVSVEQWQTEWTAIDLIINNMNLNLPEYDKDRKTIFDMIANGEIVAHHSQQFEQHYSPHYRIIEKSIFEQDIKPYINK